MKEMNTLQPASSWRPTAPVHLSELFDVTLGQGVTFRRFRHGSYGLESPAGCSDHLVALRLCGTCDVERLTGADRSACRTVAGQVTIQPAETPSSWRVEGTGEMLYLFFPQELLGRTAQERDLPFDRTRPLPRLGIEDGRLARRMKTLLAAVRHASGAPSMIAETLVMQIVSDLLSRHTQTGPALRARPIQPFPHHLRMLIADYIEAHIGEGLSIGEIAAYAGVSNSHFIHRFRRTFDTTPHRYLTALRIEKAKLHLAAGSTPVEAAMLTGFSDQAHLTTIFRRLTGTTPAAYRREARRVR
jgi:AraC family transcriptional regulator